MEIGELNKLTRGELENTIFLQMRALDILAGWYLRAVERHDHEQHTQLNYEQIRDRLVDTAVNDAHMYITYHESKKLPERDEPQERECNNKRETQLSAAINMQPPAA